MHSAVKEMGPVDSDREEDHITLHGESPQPEYNYRGAALWSRAFDDEDLISGEAAARFVLF